MEITKYEHGMYLNFEPMNKIQFPLTRLNWADFNEFNEIYTWARENCIEGRKTPSGAIAGGPSNRFHNFFILVVQPRKSVELTICHHEFGTYRFLVANKLNETNREMTGTKAIKTVYKLAIEFGVLEELQREAVDRERGQKIKKEIQSPIIKTCSPIYLGREFEHVHHIDANSSYFSRICEYNSKLLPLGEYLYNHRKENDGEYKAVMTNSIGVMQSEFCIDVYRPRDNKKKPFQLANLSKVAVNGTNQFIKDYLYELQLQGFEPLLVNTDGIWYRDGKKQGRIFTDEREGYGLGQWKHDHKDVKLYIKSPGAYQYIEDGKIKTVLRGECALDRVKPDRSTWGWKEISEFRPYTFKFVKGTGIVREYE